MTPTQAFRRYCDHFIAGDAAAIASMFTDDGEFIVPMADKPAKGRASIEKEMRQAALSQKNIQVEVTAAIDAGATGFVEANYSAEVVGTGGKLDGTPHRVDFRMVGEITLVDGKIKRLTEYLDRRPMFPEERQRVFTVNRLSPYFGKSVEEGCMEWMVYNNMHFPMIYGRMPFQEYDTLLNGVTLWDVGLERQTQLKGPDALRFMDYLSCRDMSAMKVGQCRYTLLTDENGICLCDPVVLRPSEDTIWISHGNTDITLWARGIVMGSDWKVEVSEPDIAPMQIQGPLSIEVMKAICADPVWELKNYTCMRTTVLGKDVVVSRTGWSSGEGFEIYPLSSVGATDIWDAVKKAGEPYDIMVMGPNIFRALERGVTDISYYTNSGMNALEDLGNKFVHLDVEADFIGKDALKRIRADGVRRKSVGLFIEGPVPRMEWFWDAKDARGNPGVVRWAAHSFALDRSLGIALVDASVEVGDVIEVSHPLGVVKAEVTTVPFVGKSS
ncbi:nuclear transport factor 2 family protein [Mesorhizobium sp. B2-8-5]|uniref:nuclear transport factor 2 family protein n=1 Tax=Mesorhizobium sp. B2-8-5 TaxID=2589903 RepID=UPI00112B1E99|nr:nuclear transport factor 2 family protein [Mesorhizobium sp. B2-8-5]UCI28491.1 nuclear transport factor 2 family protein [Mesorhizobium sp. B2-8-5]